MNDEIIIRMAQDTDIDGMYDLIHKALDTKGIQKIYEENIIELWKFFYSKKYIQSCMITKHLYVALMNEKVVGTAAVNIDGAKGYVSVVYVDPEIQGKGIGRKLLTALEKDEISQEKKVLYLHAALSAIKFYKKMGYDFPEKDPIIIQDCGFDMIEMEKKLSNE